MLPLFDGNIVAKQLQSARNMGAEKIIFLSSAMHGTLLQYVDALKRQSIEAEIVRSAGDLGQYAVHGDDLIFLSDGVFPGRQIEEHLAERTDERIYVVANAEEHADFELVDLNHRWLGIALLKAERLSEISEIPDDWDIGSALLRTAVQSECHRELVSDAEMQADAVPQLLNPEASAAYARRQLDSVKPTRQNFFDRFVSWPLMRKAIPLLWKAPDAKKYTGMASIACAVLAAGLGFIVPPAVPLALLFLGSMALALHDRISIFSTGHQRPSMVGPIFYLLSAITLMIAVIQDGQPASLFADLTILLLLSGNLWLANRTADHSLLHWVRPDIPLILIILLIASGSGFFFAGLNIAALFCLAYLIAAQSRDFLRESPPEPIE